MRTVTVTAFVVRERASGHCHGAVASRGDQAIVLPAARLLELVAVFHDALDGVASLFDQAAELVERDSFSSLFVPVKTDAHSLFRMHGAGHRLASFSACESWCAMTTAFTARALRR